MVDRQTGIAIWRQVADALRMQVSSGLYEAGKKLPSETQLAQQFACNRHTVRAAINALAKEGLVDARQGIGTFVLEQSQITYPISRRTRFSDGVGDQVYSTRSMLIEATTELANADIAKKMNIDIDSALIRLETISMADEIPLSRATSWFPKARLPDIDKHYRSEGSMTRALRLSGIDDYLRKSTEVEARHVTGDDEESLALSPGAIVLVTKAVNIDLEGTPIQFAKTRFAADRVRLSIHNDI